ncbi:two-component system KDP operon response regulator KdpE [Jatrophihabitans sp. GAS493]|uniref:response regulator n=1 Tax=Jatrophihabitans sp. GAS493 TaxID=1907575 RepID=UPI000BB8B938|nr:response regulator [Jatrophihabitans sp. GAS493]SOD71648.1 two-component system KDP operon response regulator KdpE [Jatrophihabitans sp. GAS493]
MTGVLLVEDDESLRRAMSMNLTAREYLVTEAGSVTAGLAAANDEAPDVVVLDLGLPDRDGLDFIREFRRRSAVPIIVLSGRLGSAARVEALDLGADDYLTKPFSMAELLARIRASIRRHGAEEQRSARIGDVTIDLLATTATRDNGDAVHLTPTEWTLLEALLRQPGRLVSRQSLLTATRGPAGQADASYLRIYMAQLRRKLEADPQRPRHLLTESGMGYRYQP